MSVQKILLHQFRNYGSLEIELSPGVNVLMGDNGQGKTNLLEAVRYCSTGRSHRTAYDRECIQVGHNDAYIKVINGDFSADGDGEERFRNADTIEIHLRKNGKKSVIINQTPLERINDLFGCIYTVLFSPEDLSLIKDGPARRRQFMDLEICQVDKVYLHYLQQYQAVLRQRNQLLKDMAGMSVDDQLLEIYDQQLAGFGTRLIRRRKIFIEQLENIAPHLHDMISGGREKVHFEYEMSLPEDPEKYQEMLHAHAAQDLRTQSTGLGPHRDDIRITIDGMDARVYGSQGQKRTAALAMKLAEMQMMEAETGRKPVLLLDDVMSELDENRQHLLVRCIEEHQTIITCTGVEDSIRKMRQTRIFMVRGGCISENGESSE